MLPDTTEVAGSEVLIVVFYPCRASEMLTAAPSTSLNMAACLLLKLGDHAMSYLFFSSFSGDLKMNRKF